VLSFPSALLVGAGAGTPLYVCLVHPNMCSVSKLLPAATAVGASGLSSALLQGSCYGCEQQQGTHQCMPCSRSPAVIAVGVM
jgi:hypothetical protein